MSCGERASAEEARSGPESRVCVCASYFFGSACLWELPHRISWFPGHNHAAALEATRAGERPDFKVPCVKGYEALQRSCVAQDAAHRPTFADVAARLDAIVATLGELSGAESWQKQPEPEPKLELEPEPEP